MDEAQRPVASLAFLSALLLTGHVLRARLRFLRLLFLPASCIGGAVGVALVLASSRLPAGGSSERWVRRELMAGWEELPSFLTNVVFATLVLGRPLPSAAELWKVSGPQLAFGQLITFGQYIVTAGVCAVWLIPAYNMPPLFATVIPVGFEGGHGVVAGLRGSYVKLGYEEGYQLGLVAATVSLLGGTVFGCIVVNWAARRGLLAAKKGQEVAPSPATPRPFLGGAEAALLRHRSSGSSFGAFDGIHLPDERPSAGVQTVAAESLDSLALHGAVMGVVLGGAWTAKLGANWLEGLSPWLSERALISSIPLFPVVLLVAVMCQAVLDRLGAGAAAQLDAATAERICASAMDFLIVSAIASMRFDALQEAAAPFAICCGVAFAWSVLSFCLLGRLLPDYWVERALTECSLALGATATALLMLRMMDPDNKTPVLRAFCYKQLIHVSIVGGGAFTVSSLPLVSALGPLALLVAALVAFFGWLLVLLCAFPRADAAPAKATNRARSDTHSSLLDGGSFIVAGPDTPARGPSI